MKLRSTTLKELASRSGKSVEELGAAVERAGLDGQRAVSAVRNWTQGRDHPRAKRADIAKLAEALGVQAGELSRFVSTVHHHRGSPKKAVLIADLIRGRRYMEARDLLAHTHKRASVNFYKALEAAAAEAESVGVDVDDLVVSESRVDQGPHIKRFQPKDRGRAHPILKRTSHITVGLERRG